jgi:hypothetical protein
VAPFYQREEEEAVGAYANAEYDVNPKFGAFATQNRG